MRGDQFSRVIRLAHLLMVKPDGITVKQIARKHKVDTRTVYRDLEVLDLAGYPVYSEKKDGHAYWKLTDDYRVSIAVPFSVDELLALHVAQKAMPGMAGVAFANSLDTAFDKIAATLQKQRFETLEKQKQTLTVDPGPLRKGGSRKAILDVIRQGKDSCESISIAYKSPSRKKVTQRVIDPYRLHAAKGATYLVAWCHLRKELRNFLVDRIRIASATGKHFTRVHEEETTNWYASAFSTYTGKPQNISLRFELEAVPYLRERVWHSSQSLEELSDGRIRMRLHVYPGPDLEAWLRSWGSLVEVLKPQSLRKKMAKELQAAAEKYDDKLESRKSRSSNEPREKKTRASPRPRKNLAGRQKAPKSRAAAETAEKKQRRKSKRKK